MRQSFFVAVSLSFQMSFRSLLRVYLDVHLGITDDAAPKKKTIAGQKPATKNDLTSELLRTLLDYMR